MAPTAVALALGAAMASVTPPAAGAPGDEHVRRLWETAVEACEAERWEDGVHALEALVSLGVDDAAVHYDLGNAYFHAGKFGRAIVAYERALRIDPGDGDADHNAEVAERASLAAAGDDPAGALGRAELPLLERVVARFTADAWAGFLGAVWIAAFGGLAARRLLRTGAARGLATAVAIAAGTLVPPAALGLYARDGFDHARDRAIVVTPRATLRTGPSKDNPAAFDVREGIRVRVTGEDMGWLKVRLTDGLEAWAPPGSVERI